MVAVGQMVKGEDWLATGSPTGICSTELIHHQQRFAWTECQLPGGIRHD
jgi:hypothetical protein